ncbi:hypothetical protein ACHAXH_006821 [Discostella pseudostelligera]
MKYSPQCYFEAGKSLFAPHRHTKWRGLGGWTKWYTWNLSFDTNTYICGDWASSIPSFTKQYNLSFDAITFSGESNSSFMTASTALRIS